MMRKFLILIGFIVGTSFSASAFAGTYHECSCGYDGISGNWALTVQVKNFDNETVRSHEVGTFYSQRQCQQQAATARTCAVRSADSRRHCECEYDAISGDYLLTSYLYDLDGNLVYEREVATFFGSSQCSGAALNYAVCQ